MKQELRVLLVEDNLDDAELVGRCLRKAGYSLELERVDTTDALQERVAQGTWDVVISDHVLPRLSSGAALRIVKDREPDMPFIVVSGRIGEETAVEAVQAGADDYVMKDRLARLAPAVERAIAHRDLRRKQREQEAELRRAQQLDALGTLAAGMAHDINNILTAVLINAELARHDNPPAAITENLVQITSAAERGRELVRKVLAFGRPGHDTREPIQLAAVVEEVAALLRPGLPREITLHVMSRADVPIVLADPAQMHQVVMNLVTNAVHALEGMRGRITIDVKRVDVTEREPVGTLPAGPFVCVRVGDTGRGMDAETLERVFEPFFTTKPVGNGTGLGLATVHQIVSHHGGAVTAQSRPRRGTTFTVYLPASAARVERPVDVADAVVHLSGGKRILYVEDEALVAMATTRVLQNRGFEVTAVQTAHDALDILRRDPQGVDLVLTDQNLPDGNGLELACALETIRLDLPVIVTSGVRPDGATPPGSNVRGWLAKPYSDRELSHALDAALEQRS